VTELSFIIAKPAYEPATATARFAYQLGDLHFAETLHFPQNADIAATQTPAFTKLLDLTAAVLGVSYFKLLAPFDIALPDIALTPAELEFVRDVYENGLGEFYARNDLKRFGKLNITAKTHTTTITAPNLPDRVLLPIGGGKDSLVSVQLLEKAGLAFTPFAVNPKGPILTSVEKIGKPALYVTRTLDAEMIRLGTTPGYYNGHVPSTAINSMIAALTALLFGYNRIALSNERSASEGNMTFDGREANHQHSKSLPFERLIAETLSNATGGALGYFSLLRPYSEARIAALFARESRFDKVFSSCNRNFKLSGHDGPLWCGECPKCHFTFLILAPEMEKQRLLAIFGQNLLAKPQNELPYRELTGLAGQKPWECVGEILEAAACLWTLTKRPDWQDDLLVKTLKADLEAQYGATPLQTAMADLKADTNDHLIPADLVQQVSKHAL